MAEFSHRSQKVISYQSFATHLPLQAARIIISRVYGAQHIPKMQTIMAKDLAIFLSLESRDPGVLRPGTMQEAVCWNNLEFFLCGENFSRCINIWLALGSPLEEGDKMSSSSMTAEIATGSLDITFRVLTKNTDQPAPSLCFSLFFWGLALSSAQAAPLLFLRWMLR